MIEGGMEGRLLNMPATWTCARGDLSYLGCRHVYIRWGPDKSNLMSCNVHTTPNSHLRQIGRKCKGKSDCLGEYGLETCWILSAAVCTNQGQQRVGGTNTYYLHNVPCPKTLYTISSY